MVITTTLIWVISYLFVGIYHGGWALREQTRRYPDSIQTWKMVLVYSIAVFLWPVTLPWGIINYLTEPNDKK